MCNYSDFVANRSRKEGEIEGKAEALVNLMQKLKMSIEQAFDTLNIPESEWDDYRVLVKQLEAHSAQ